MIRALFALLSLLVVAQADAAITRRFVGVGASATNGGAVVPTLGGTTNAGDLIICDAGQRDATDYTTISASGYTVIGGANGSTDPSVAVLAKIAAGGDGNPTISSSDTTSGRSLIAHCTVYAGAQASLVSIVAHVANTSNGSSEDVTTPALTISTANTLVHVVGVKNNDWESQDVLSPSGFTENAQTERTASQQVGITSAYQVQTTATNISAGIFDGQSGNFAVGVSIILSIKPAAVAPTFSVAPTACAQDENDYTLCYTVDSACTFKAVACLKDSATPTEAQIKAGNCTGDAAAQASASEAVTGADTTTLGGALGLPIYDIHSLCTGAGGDTSIVSLTDERLDPPAGYQDTLLASVSSTSPCASLNASITPDIAAADVVRFPTTTSPSGYPFTVSTDCNTSYPDSSGSRQYATLAVYDTSAGGWMSGGPTPIYFNNSAPQCLVANCEFDSDELFIDGVAMASINTATWFDDADGDTPTITSSDTGTGTGADKRPAGTSISSGVWSGTPTCNGGNTSGSFTITATDVAGDTETVDVTWTCYDQVTVPDCVGDDVSDCLTELDGAGFSGVLYAQCEGVGAAATGTVIAQSPAAAASADYGSSVYLAANLGACPTYIGGTLPNLRFVKNQSIGSRDFSDKFAAGDESIVGCSLIQMGATSNVTTASGAGSNSRSLTVVDSASITPSSWIKIGSAYARVASVNWSTHVVTLVNPTSWADAAVVATVSLSVNPVSGVDFTSGTCTLTGTPTSSATNSNLIIRATDSNGLHADSP